METTAGRTHIWTDVIDPFTTELYIAYHRRTFVGERCAVLAIDLYNKVYRGGNRPIEEVSRDFPSACGAYAWEAVEPTERLFAAARAQGIPIIYTTSAKGKIKATYRGAEQEFNDDFHMFPAFAPQDGDLIIHKERASAFFGTPLIAYLQQLNIDSLLICGESTSGCVRASAVDAYSFGFHVSLAEECCFDRSLISHKVSLFDLHHKYADVMHVDDILAEWKQEVAAR